MGSSLRWSLVTAVAPIAWGTTYYVTRRYLPPDYPLYGAAIRALPAGLVLLAASRRLPHGDWWWKAVVLGVLNMSAFFVFVYLAAQRLPTSVAATIMAMLPAAMMLFAWLIIAERPRALPLTGALIGFVGVCMMLLGGTAQIDTLGVFASVAAMATSAVGYVLAKKWSTGPEALALTSWQLLSGGAILAVFAVLAEGAPPTLNVRAVGGFTFVTLVGTALAFGVWFAGLRHLSVATVGLIGLLAPVSGVLLGAFVARDVLSGQQIAGIALVLMGVLSGQPAVVGWCRRKAWWTAQQEGTG
jgi:probable blue pigment (indigoidine) exporter